MFFIYRNYTGFYARNISKDSIAQNVNVNNLNLKDSERLTVQYRRTQKVIIFQVNFATSHCPEYAAPPQCLPFLSESSARPQNGRFTCCFCFRLPAGNKQQKISTVRINLCRKGWIVFTTLKYEPTTHNRSLEKWYKSLHKCIHEHAEGRGLGVRQVL